MQIITVPQLLISFIPVFFVLILFYAWSMRWQTVVYAFSRMTVQLILIGYILTYLFTTNYSLIVVAVLLVMIFIASYIALRPLAERTYQLYIRVLISISVAGTLTLLFVSQYVLALDPWFSPQYMIPLAGLVYANAMNTVSLAAERFDGEFEKDADYNKARNLAFTASLIPMINTLLAIGLVSLPGIMSGQVLSGVSPMIAVRYQIVVMCMIFASSTGATMTYLWLAKKAK